VCLYVCIEGMKEFDVKKKKTFSDKTFEFLLGGLLQATGLELNFKFRSKNVHAVPTSVYPNACTDTFTRLKNTLYTTLRNIYISYLCIYSCTIAVRLAREEQPASNTSNKGW
jgi:hypothetical protein